MLGEGRRRSPGRVGLAVDPHTGVHLRHFAAVLADHSIEQTALAQARIGRHLVQPMDRAGRDAVPGEQSEPMVPFARAENLLDPGHELRPRRSSPGVGRESWLVGHRGLTDGAAKPPPDGIVAGPEGERLVGGPEDLVDRQHAVLGAGAPRQLARAEIGDQPRGHEPRHALDQRHVDLMAASRTLPVEQGGDGGERGVHSSEQIGRRGADLLGLALGLAGQIHHARKALGDQVVAGTICPLAVEAEAGQRDVDQIRPRRLERPVIGSKPGLQAWQLIRNHHVGLAQQLQKQRVSLGSTVVEGDALLVAVDRKEPKRFAIEEWRAPMPRIVADPGRSTLITSAPTSPSSIVA